MGKNTQDSPPHPPIGRHQLGHFGHELSEMVPADPAVTCVISELDDVLFFGDTFYKMLGQLHLFLNLCRRRNLRLSPRKTNIDNFGRNSSATEILQKKNNLPRGSH